MKDQVDSIAPWRGPDGGLFFALSVTMLFLLLAGFTTFHHEMWRDEMGPWLIARDSRSLLDIYHNIRYDGHPSLWYLLLWFLTFFTTNPETMQWLNLGIAACAVFLIARISPFPRWMRIAVALGYYPVYEYGAISRNYALGFLCLAAFCSLFPFRRERPLLMGALLLAAANTSILACILAIALLIMLMTENLTCSSRAAERKAAWGGMGIAAMGIAFAVWQMIPPPDTGYAMGWHFGFDPARLEQVLKNMTAAYLPLPKPGHGFWETEFLAAFSPYRHFSWLGAPAILILVSVALLRRPLALCYFLIGSLGLLAFFYVKHVGYLRHHGFLFICFGTALWLAAAMQPVVLPGAVDAASRFTERVLSLLVPVFLAVQLAGTLIAVAGEYRYPFSAARETAAMIRSHGLDKLPMVADLDVTGMPVVGYLDKSSAYYPCGDRYGSYVVWDTARMLHSIVWGEPLQVAKKSGTPVVVLVDDFVIKKFPPPPELQADLELIGCRTAGIVTDESYCVYLYQPGKDTNPARK